MKQCMLCGRESENDVCPVCEQEYNLSEPEETLQEETQAISSVWINMGRVLVWISFVFSIIGILVGVVLLAPEWPWYCIVAFVFGGVFCALFFLSIFMVYFDMGEDIKNIRSHFKKKK